MPTTNGLPFLATIISSVFSLEITAIAYAPTTSFKASRTDSNSEVFSFFCISSINEPIPQYLSHSQIGDLFFVRAFFIAS